MKRDFDLIRRILTDIERMPAGSFQSNLKYPEYSQATVDEHTILLHDAGLIKANISKLMGGGNSIHIVGLTWSGHDFLDAMKDDNLWNKAKENVLKPGVSITFDVLLEWLKIQAKQKLGLP
jgi:hypothetical protein